MKKITFTLLVAFFSICSFSQGLPLEGFENTGGPDLPAPTTPSSWTLDTSVPGNTWQVFDNNVGLIRRWDVINGAGNIFAGANAAFIDRDNVNMNNTSEDYLATPLVTIPANGQLKFWTRTGTNGDQGTIFQIKVAPATANQINPNAYNIVQQWSENTLHITAPATTPTNADIYIQKTVDLSAFAGQQVYVAFVRQFLQPTGSIGGDRWFIDDVQIIQQCFNPTLLTATAITFNSANLSWTSPGVTTWQIEVLPAASTPTGVGVTYSGPLPYLATGLLPNTAYQFFVRSVCSPGNFSGWSGPSNFTTGIAPPVCGGNFVDSGGIAGNYANNTDNTVTICPIIATDVVTVTFTSFNTQANNDGLYVFNGDSVAAPQISSGNPAGLVPGGLAGAYWGTANIGSFTSSAANGCLTFRFRSNATTVAAGWVANVTCAPAPVCPQPNSIVTGAVLSSSVALSWAEAGTATTWNVIALPCGSPAPNASTTGFLTANTNTNFVYTGLNGDTCYNFYVRAACSGGTFSNWSGPRIATTQITPPACGGIFTDLGGATANYPNGADSTVTICPTIPGEQVTVTFTAFNTETNWDGLYVFNGNSIAATQIASANPPGNVPGGLAGSFWGTTIPGPFTGEDATGCLTFRFRSDGSVNNPGWVANVTCAPAPTCPRPINIVATATTSVQTTLSWTSPGPATSWQVLALPCGSPAPTASSTGFVTASTNTNFVLAGLTPDTCYNIYVRSVCSPTDLSLWSTQPPIVQTQQIPPACGGTYSDLGGSAANYPNNADSTVTICPITPGDAVTVTFTSFNVQANNDGLYLFNGDTIGAPQIVSGNPAGAVPGGLAGAFWGTANIGAFTSSAANGCLTFRFRSNATVNAAGWVANVTCAPATNCPQPISIIAGAVLSSSVALSWTETGTATTWNVLALPCGSPAPNASTTGFATATTNTNYVLTGLTGETCYNIYVRSVCSPTTSSTWTGPRTVTTQQTPPACGGIFTDLGGATANYPNGADSTITICPVNPTDQVTVTFTSFNTETNWDALYVFNGNSITSPQIASANPPGNVPGGLAGGFWGTAIPGPFTGESLNGCLTFRFRSDGSVNNPGWVANVTCAPPPTCPRPINVTASLITQTSASFAWTETGTATQWEILVLPAGSPLPNASSTGFVTANTNTGFVVGNLASGTQFQVYVRARCSPTDASLWSVPTTFATLITNDECANAIVVPVNPDTLCGQVVGGTLIGATASTTPIAPCTGTPNDDVWFQFTATTTAHSISLLNITGSTTNIYHALYSGSCGTLTNIACSPGTTSNATTLTPGQTYYIRVYSFGAAANATTIFNVCIGTIPPPITATTVGYTNQQLIENVLLGTTCANVSNITSSSGNNFGSANGIGYFNQNGSSFPFEEGVVLATRDVNFVPGPNNINPNFITGWPGDAQLFNYIQGLGIDPFLNSYNDASVLEFDFVPLTENISFDFIFASEEYGIFQCDYSDAFAFFLTNTTTNVTTNLAIAPPSVVYPGVPVLPISVTTVRDNQFNAGCPSVNAPLFADYYLQDQPGGLNPLGAPINFNGLTVPLTATSPVTVGQQYHIKLVIADRNDSGFDSAIFLKGGSLDIGNIQLGQDFLTADGTALCFGGSYTIESGLSGPNYTYIWSKDGVVLVGEVGPNLIVNTTGVYTLSASYTGTTCATSDSVTIEFYNPVAAPTPNNLIACNNLGFSQFDLSTNDASSLGTLDPTQFVVTYFANVTDANANLNPLPNLYTNTTAFLQTIFARVTNTTTSCFAVNAFDLIVQDLAPQFSITPDFSICAGTTGTITVTPINYNDADVIYSWTRDGVAISNTTNTLTVNQGGVYVVTIDNMGCTATGTTNVTVTPIPIADSPSDVTACSSYILPALTNGNYFTGTNGTGNALAAQTAITTSQTIFVYAQSGTNPNCTAQNSFTVTINSIVAQTIANITACTSYILPTLNANNSYFTGTNGSGTQLTAGSVITTTQLIYVFAQTGTTPNCTNETTFTVTILQNPVLPDFINVSACNSYTLPALPNGSYFSQPNGVGAVAVGTTINSTQVVYVYLAVGTAPNVCFTEKQFQVTITDSPTFTISGECVGTNYVLTAELSSTTIGGVTYQWKDSNGTNLGTAATQIVNTNGTYSCEVTLDGSTCSSVELFSANETACSIQKGISPNNDGLNDSFDLTGLGVKKLTIYNRYGTKVYSKSEYTNQWNGQTDSGNDLPDGTYYYVVERNQGESNSGWVYISREIR